MTDAQIRLSFKRIALEKHFEDPDTVILDELGLRHGATRVDVAVVNGLLHGFEIKSDRDNLLRLRQQSVLYSSVLDRATLIVGPRHLEKASEIVPSWWGIEKVESCDGQLVFRSIREASSNPLIDALSVAKLLWRQEALELLEEHGAARGYVSKSRLAIYERLIEVVEVNVLRERVRRQLKVRKGQKPALELK